MYLLLKQVFNERRGAGTYRVYGTRYTYNFISVGERTGRYFIQKVLCNCFRFVIEIYLNPNIY